MTAVDGSTAYQAAQRLPNRPFHRSEMRALGLSNHQLHGLLVAGVVRRVFRSVYAPARIVDDDPGERALAASLAVSDHHVLCDRTAAWVWGIDVFTYAEAAVTPQVEVCAIAGHEPTHATGLQGHSRALAREDVLRVGGVAVTSPLRTALDLGARLTRRDAMATLDAFCRVHGVTRPVLRRELPRFRGRRGVVQLRELVELVDGRAESVRESWTRLAIHDAGLPAPTPQVWVEVRGKRFRLDLAYPRHRIVVEYDGRDAHDVKPGQLERDRKRRRLLRADGWTVIVLRLGDFSGDQLLRWLSELEAALRATYCNIRALERGDRTRLKPPLW